MASGRQQVTDKIDAEWAILQEAIAAVPVDQLVGAAFVGNWSAKDLMGHITTWEAEAMDNVGRFLDPLIGELRTYPDTDGFNEQTSEEKRRIPLVEIQRALAETHSSLLKFLQDLPDSDFDLDEVDRRLALDTYDHYTEHAEHFRAFVAAGLE